MKMSVSTVIRFCYVLVLAMVACIAAPSVLAEAIEVDAAEYERGPLPPEKAFVFQYIDAGNGHYIFDWNIPKYYYMYKEKLKFIPTTPVAMDVRFSDNHQLYSDIYFGEIDVYRQKATVDLRLLEPVTEPIQMLVSYQGCWDGGVCYPPQKININIQNSGGAGSLFGEVGQRSVSALSSLAEPQQNLLTQQKTQVVQAQPVNQPNTTTSVDFSSLVTNGEDQNFFLQVVSEGNVLWLMLVFYLSGLALTFTPCVFPTIPLVSGIITRSAENITPLRGFWLTSVFVLSASLTYSLVGIMVGFLGQNLQVLLQQTWIIVTSAMIFVVLAAAMFGVFTLQMPMSIQQKINTISGKQNNGSVYGLAGMGVLSTLIVGPCLTAPLAGILVYLGGQSSPAQGGLSLFMLGLGMGTPLLIAGTVAGKWLPKAGAWLGKIQALFGFIMLLMAVWMLDRVIADDIALLLYGVVLIFFGTYMWQISGPSKSLPTGGSFSFLRGVSLVALLFGVLQIIGYSIGSTNIYQPLRGGVVAGQSGVVAVPVEAKQGVTITTKHELLQQISIASEQGKPVMVKFAAEWCVACEQIDREVFANPSVINSGLGIYKVVADVTDVNDNALDLLATYNLPGPPAVLFFDKAGQFRQDLLLLGNITKEKVMSHYDQVKS